ncbi:MAG: hypothetical protein LBT14_11865 [Treponema sp.]|jgi:hypothetical protein|nr:hypothetical protein [Treponema sp.]
MKKTLGITIGLLIMTTLFTAAVFADSAGKKGETWQVAYKIVRTDTQATVEEKTLTKALDKDEPSVEAWAKTQLGFPKGDTREVKKVPQQIQITALTPPAGGAAPAATPAAAATPASAATPAAATPAPAAKPAAAPKKK